jgi:hypothetical protein
MTDSRHDDYLDRGGLLTLDLDEPVVDRLLRDTPLRGHDGRPVVAAADLPDLLALLDTGGRAEP